MNGGTRASGTPGFDASAAYVIRRLERAGYGPSSRRSPSSPSRSSRRRTFQRVSPDPRTYAEPAEFATMDYSGSGDVTAPITAVDVVLPPGAPGSSTSGCEDADYASFPAGNVALVQRGTCTFGEKAPMAQAHNASAVIVFNEGQPGRTDTIARHPG